MYSVSFISYIYLLHQNCVYCKKIIYFVECKTQMSRTVEVGKYSYYLPSHFGFNKIYIFV